MFRKLFQKFTKNWQIPKKKRIFDRIVANLPVPFRSENFQSIEFSRFKISRLEKIWSFYPCQLESRHTFEGVSKNCVCKHMRYRSRVKTQTPTLSFRVANFAHINGINEINGKEKSLHKSKVTPLPRVRRMAPIGHGAICFYPTSASRLETRFRAQKPLALNLAGACPSTKLPLTGGWCRIRKSRQTAMPEKRLPLELFYPQGSQEKIKKIASGHSLPQYDSYRRHVLHCVREIGCGEQQSLKLARLPAILRVHEHEPIQEAVRVCRLGVDRTSCKDGRVNKKTQSVSFVKPPLLRKCSF